MTLIICRFVIYEVLLCTSFMFEKMAGKLVGKLPKGSCNILAEIGARVVLFSVFM